ncbi:hypothetical protein [Aquisalimonas sp.]|uniref:poly(ethylene terephthalate) hydrolase family protein n=1 Tax=unclassified Aquisalimonas TaxID=2644645 RepID=UPI0025C4572F|nr:hypothetical protein [Aquisalimonas sp.]
MDSIKKETTLAAWLTATAFALATGTATALSPGNGDDLPPPEDDETGTGFPSVSDFADDGPYSTTSSTESGGWFSDGCEIHYPTNLGDTGLQHPVIIWGNGTGTSPTSYNGLLSHWASHGFVVAAAETSSAGDGEDMIDCLDYLEQENANGSSVYAGNLDMDRVATSGHSQGGGGSIMAGQDPRVTATAPMQPYVIGLGHDSDSQSNQNGPMFLMSGSSDTIAGPILNQSQVFNNTNVPVFWGTLDGAGHFEPVGSAGDFRGPSTAWMRYYLMDDAHAANVFFGADCVLCQSSDWDVETRDIN